jgi:glycosyltransferase involved in cell wall biosynthesis
VVDSIGNWKASVSALGDCEKERAAPLDTDDRRVESAEEADMLDAQAVVVRELQKCLRPHRGQVVKPQMSRIRPALDEPIQASQIRYPDREAGARREELHVPGECRRKVVEMFDEPERQHEVERARRKREEVGFVNLAADSGSPEVLASQRDALGAALDPLDACAEPFRVKNEPGGGSAADLEDTRTFLDGCARRESSRQRPLDWYARIRPRGELDAVEVLLFPEGLVDEVFRQPGDWRWSFSHGRGWNRQAMKAATSRQGKEGAAPRELWLLNEGEIMGGGEWTTLRLAGFAHTESPRPYAVRLLSPRQSLLGQSALVGGVEVVDLKLPPLRLTADLGTAVCVLRLRRLVRASAPDAVFVGITPRAHAYLLAAAATLRRPRSIVNLLIEQETAGRRSARFAYRHAGRLLALGENTKRTYERVLPGVPISSANNILTRKEFEHAAAAVPKQAETPPVLGFLGRLIPEKGLLELVEELAAVRNAWRKLLVAGPRQDERYASCVEERIAAVRVEDAIDVLGPVDTPSFLRRIDALVVPSTGTEGQPTVIIEALAHGVPVIVRKAVWSRELEGLPVQPYASVGEFAQALANLPSERADTAQLLQRFGPLQLLEAIEEAAPARSPARS